MDAPSHAPAWAGYAPLAVLALVMLLRLRTLHRARRLRVGGLIVLPVIFVVLVAVLLWANPPSVAGWGCLAGGAVVGAMVGWQRARMMRLHIDAASGAVMMRQTPAALILLVAIAGLRRTFAPAQIGGDLAHMPSQALLVTDGLLGFALAMIVSQRLMLWKRARALTQDAQGPG